MSGAVLDRNLGALLRRAYRPVRPNAEFRGRLLAMLGERLDSPAPARRPVWSPRLVRGLALAAAGLLLGVAATLAWRAGREGEELAGGGAAPSGASQVATPGGKREEAPDSGSAGRRSPLESPGAVAAAEPGESPVAPDAILGSVRDEETGEPLEEFRIVLLREEGLFEVSQPIVRKFAGAGGRFSVEGLKSGGYRLFVEAEGFAVRSREAATGKDPLEIALEHGGSVRGVVVDRQSGRPVAGASVVSDTDAPIKVLPSGPGDLPGITKRIAASGEEGTFVLPRLSSGEQVLRAVREGYAPAWTEVLTLAPGEAREGIVLRLGRGGGVRGTVRGEGGEPLARQTIIAASSDFDPRRRMSYGRGATDAAGRYEIADLPEGFHVVLWFGEEDDYGSPPRGVLPARIEVGRFATVDFGAKEPEGGVLRGRALDARGAPIPGLALSVQRVGDESPTGWRTAPAGADGSYRFTGLRPGPYAVCAGRSETFDFTRVSEVEVPASGEAAGDLFLEDGAVAGAVSDAAAGGPVAGAILLLERIPGAGGEEDFAGKSIADGAGRYRFSFVAPGSYRVTAFDPTGARGFSRREPVGVAKGEAASGVDLSLGPGARARVLVQDERGRPVAGARVRIFDPAGREAVGSLEDTTGADGAFDAEGLPPGRWEFRAEGNGRRSEAAIALLEAASSAEVTLILSPP